MLLKYGVESEGYWNSEKFIKPMGDVVISPKGSHTYCTPWSVFQDGSDKAVSKLMLSILRIVTMCFGFSIIVQATPSAEDALNVNRMNVQPGGA